MRTFLLIALLVLLQGAAFGIDVPSKMRFADLELTLTDGARAYIADFSAKLQKSPTYFAALVDKANVYMPIVESAFEEAKAPADLRFIVIQESAFNGAAVSTSGAVGFWQFKEAAAREVGLRIDGSIDERKHIYRSSYGAASYFARINRDFDNWVYAVIGYNRGPVGALSFVDAKRYGSKQLTVTQHTHWYALKALAYKLMFEEEIGKKAPSFSLEAHRTEGESSVARLAERHGLTVEDFIKYNLWIKGNKLPSDSDFMYHVPGKGAPVKPGKEKPILADNDPPQVKPAPAATSRKDRRFQYIDPASDPDHGVDYVIAKPGEQLVEISVRYGKRLKKLQAYNGSSSGDRPEAGAMVYLKAPKKVHFHIAAEGDTWSGIASRYDMDLGKLKKLNRVETLGPKLYAGQKVHLKKRKPKGEKITLLDSGIAPSGSKRIEAAEAPKKAAKADPPAAKEKPAAEKGGKYHTVSAGETLWGISQKNGCSVEDIRRLNGLKGSSIYVGQRLRVR